ncbi:MAG: MerR family transcriptional regulator [Gammaproteobacteria bacterium]
MSMQIGGAAETLGMSPDTLRYYEKINLVPRAGKNGSGRREYSEKDLARLRFVQRAQRIGFSLTEIGRLLKLRENPGKASKATRLLAEEKCREMDENLHNLKNVRNELTLLLNLCNGNTKDCPIIERLDRS